MLRVCRGVLNLPQPRLAIGGIMDDQIFTGVFTADDGRIVAGIARPGAQFDRHSVGVRIVMDDWFHIQGLKLRSQNTLWTVSPSASTMTRSQRCRASALPHSRSRPSAWRCCRKGRRNVCSTSSDKISRRSSFSKTLYSKYNVRQNGGGGSRSAICRRTAQQKHAHPAVVLGRPRHADILALELAGVMQGENRRQRLGDVDAAFGRHRLDPRGAADMGAEEIIAPEDRIARRIDRPEMAADTQA